MCSVESSDHTKTQCQKVCTSTHIKIRVPENLRDNIRQPGDDSKTPEHRVVEEEVQEVNEVLF